MSPCLKLNGSVNRFLCTILAYGVLTVIRFLYTPYSFSDVMEALTVSWDHLPILE